MRVDPPRRRPWLPLALVLILVGCGQAAVQPPSPAQASAAAGVPVLRLAAAPVAVHTLDVDYLREEGKTFQATIYQPEGPGPFPAILDVHGGAWVNAAARRDTNALMDRALAAMGMVVVAIDFRQDSQHRYPDSVVDVNFALRWLRANAAKFNASPKFVGAFGTSSGGHLVLLNGLRSYRYAALPLAGVLPGSASPDYIIVAYPISDPLARRAYAQQLGNDGPVKGTDIYFSAPGSLQDGNPQLILDRRERVKLPPVLLLQGSADANGVVNDTNVSPEIQQRFAASYHAAGGRIQLEWLPGAPHNFDQKPGANFDRALGLMKIFIGQQLAGQ